MTFETNDNYSIRFKISNNSSSIRFDSIQNEKNTFRTALIVEEAESPISWSCDELKYGMRRM